MIFADADNMTCQLVGVGAHPETLWSPSRFAARPVDLAPALPHTPGRKAAPGGLFQHQAGQQHRDGVAELGEGNIGEPPHHHRVQRHARDHVAGMRPQLGHLDPRSQIPGQQGLRLGGRLFKPVTHFRCVVTGAITTRIKSTRSVNRLYRPSATPWHLARR